MSFSKICKYLFLLIFTLFFYNTCGIEDDVLYVQESKNITYDESSFYLYFDGYNQEEDDGTYLFIGYDIYYYFDTASNARLAQVRNPLSTVITLPHNVPLINFTTESRFSSMLAANSNDVNNIYEWVTVPVKETYITDILYSGNSSNVGLYLYNYPNYNVNGPHTVQTGYTNPGNQRNSSKVILTELYPNYSQYKNTTWGDQAVSSDYTNGYATPTQEDKFWGFLDNDFMTNCVPATAKIDATSYYMYVYVVAKSFNSKAEMTRADKIVESLASSKIRIKVTVYSGS